MVHKNAHGSMSLYWNSLSQLVVSGQVGFKQVWLALYRLPTGKHC